MGVNVQTRVRKKSKKREAAEAEVILQLCVLHNCKIAELPLNAAEQENDMRLCRTELAEAGDKVIFARGLCRAKRQKQE